MWYGKAPGVDRTGDVFKHANFAGTWPKGGVLAVAGDDHSCKSSTLPSQSEYAFQDFEMPVLAPADVQEVLDYGLLGYALSRFSGLWVGLIALADTMDSGATIDVGLDRHRFVLPENFRLPAGGLGIRLKDQPMDKERRLRLHKLPAALAFARANDIDRTVLTSFRAAPGHRRPRPGLGRRDGGPARPWGSAWPRPPTWACRSTRSACPGRWSRPACAPSPGGLETLMVVEHKRPLLETQARAALYDLPAHAQPRVIGKVDEQGHPLLSELGSLSVAEVALAIADRLPPGPHMERVHAYLDRVSAAGMAAVTPGRRPDAQAVLLLGLSAQHLDPPAGGLARPGRDRLPLHGQLLRPQHRPHQPHGRRGPELGRRLAVHQREATSSSIWATAPTTTPARWPSAARSRWAVDITYKLLFNDAVAMTGGQRPRAASPFPRSPASWPPRACKTIVVVADELERYREVTDLAPGVDGAAARRADGGAARAARDARASRVLIYDQVCATEKRRRRKRGTMAQAAKRVFINSAGLRGLRRLLARLQLRLDRAAGHRVRPQAADRPVDLQPGLFLRRRLLPLVRDPRGRARTPSATPCRR